MSALPAAGQALTPAGPRGEKALDAREAARAAKRTLESALLYGASQLAMWVARPESEVVVGASVEMELDEADGPSLAASGGPGGGDRKAVPLAERRRNMTGEIAQDLLSLLSKTRPVLVKTGELLGEKESDLMAKVLTVFVQEHVIAVQ